MKNNALKNELKTILATKNVTVSKGTISGNSIEVTSDGEVQDLGSFTYYDDEAKRDGDYDKLLSLIEK
jgi:hypothetical protein